MRRAVPFEIIIYDKENFQSVRLLTNANTMSILNYIDQKVNGPMLAGKLIMEKPWRVQEVLQQLTSLPWNYTVAMWT